MKRYLVNRVSDNAVVSIGVEGENVVDLQPQSPSTTTELQLAPLLVDLQVNGRLGIDFLQTDLSPEMIRQAAQAMDRDAVAWALPTVTTQTHERLHTALTRLGQAIADQPFVAARFPFIHLEGPYLSPHDGPRGAHPRSCIRPPDWDEFQRLQEAARGKIRLVTLSPEYDEAPDFIRLACDSGVLVSLGHLAASRDQILRAVDAGATLSTHLGNGAHGQLPRHPNYLWDQLADDRLTAMVIADGHHVPDEFLKCVVRCKGTKRVIAVSDLTGLGGMPPGRYDATALGDVEILEDGKLVVAGQRQFLAGAARPLWMAIDRLAQATDLTLTQAIESCSQLPAELIATSDFQPESLAPADSPQTFTGWVFSATPTPNTMPGQPLAVFRNGKLVYSHDQ